MPVGNRIRALREARGLTQAAFAKSVGVSTGLISQVEHGLTDPSLHTLRRIAQSLELPIFSLFQEEGAVDPVRVIRQDRRMHVRSPHGDITYSRISGGVGQLELLEGRLEPAGTSSEEPWSHPSEECTVVLSGQLTVAVGDDSWELANGDSCSFNSRLPHRYLNEGDETCRFLIAVTPPSY